jgi:hypothetical protein
MILLWLSDSYIQGIVVWVPLEADSMMEITVQGIYLGAFCNSYQWKVVGGGEVGNGAGWIINQSIYQFLVSILIL